MKLESLKRANELQAELSRLREFATTAKAYPEAFARLRDSTYRPRYIAFTKQLIEECEKELEAL